MLKNKNKDSQVEALRQLDSSDVLDKYKTAGRIAAEVMDKIVEYVTPGTQVFTLCKIGDTCIENLVKTVYNKKKFNKGVAFPTCVSLNNYAGYFSPVENVAVIEEGDIVNIELGVHIDGYPACLGYTVVVNSNPDKPITGKKAKLMHAVSEASKSVFHLFKAGKTNVDVANKLKECAEKYDCNLLYVDNPDQHAPGIITHQISRYVLDGNNDDNCEDVHQIILSRHAENYDFTMRELELEENEVYSVDIMMSTGTGKINPTLDRVSIFKRTDNFYAVKRKSSKEALKVFNKKFPMSLRTNSTALVKAGLLECVQRDLLEPYGVYVEKEGEYVAQVKFTVVVKKNKPILITGRSSDLQLAKVSLK